VKGTVIVIEGDEVYMINVDSLEDLIEVLENVGGNEVLVVVR